MQGIFAILLLILALLVYWWGRKASKPRAVKKPVKEVLPENPDVVLGLTETLPPKSTVAAPTEIELTEKTSPPKPVETQRIILFLRAAAGRPYSGYELLQSLLSCGLRFGEMDIFHRFQSEGDKIIFSVAAATSSGRLIPADMAEFTCQGLSLFLTLDFESNGLYQFELLLETARQLTDDLGGVVLDENQQIITSEKIQIIEEKIKSFETKKQTLELFA